MMFVIVVVVVAAATAIRKANFHFSTERPTKPKSNPEIVETHSARAAAKSSRADEADSEPFQD